MFIGRFPCGGLAAIQPDEITDGTWQLCRLLGRWHVRGWRVERIERLRDALIPNMRCGNKDCPDCYQVVYKSQTL